MQGTRLSYLKKGLISQSGFLLLATGIGYAFSYLYLLFMGRVLGPADFGILGSLVAIFYITALVGQALMQAIATNVAEIKAKGGEGPAAAAFIKLGLKLGALGVLPAIGVIAAARPIADFLHYPSTAPIFILAFSLFTVLLLAIVLGLQQGLQRFTHLGITGYLVGQGLKFLLGVAFVLMGGGLSGAMAALLGSTAIAAVIGLMMEARLLSGNPHSSTTYRLKIAPVIIPALLLAIFLSMPTGVDVMLVTHFFGGKESGLYNSAATIGKVVVFLPMAVSFIMLPKVTESHALGQDARKTLLQALVLTSLLSGMVAIVSWLFPTQIINLFFGEAYLEANRLLGLYVGAMLLFSLDVVLMHYAVATRNLRVMMLFALVTLAEVAGMWLFRESLTEIIWVLITGNMSLLVASSLWFALSRGNERRPALEN